MKSTAERGLFKEQIHGALYKNENILELLIGEKVKDMTPAEKISQFKDHVKSHVFVEDTITDATTYIFYDVVFPFMENRIKTCQVVMYLICHREILENYTKEGYYGDRIDILSQMVEDSLINDKETARSFGIGELDLDYIEVYNSTRFYGCVMYFSVPNFR